MSEALPTALARMRALLLDDETLVRAVGSGRRRGTQPPWRRVELRYVDLKAGRHLQVTAYDDAQAHTSNHAVGDATGTAVDDLLDLPFGNWHVDTTTETHQLRVTKKGDAVVHARARAEQTAVDRDHDRDKGRLLRRGRPGLPCARAQRPRGPDEAEPAGQVPPGRGVPADPRLLDHRRDRQGAPAHAHGRRAAADRRPRLRQRLPDLRHPPLPHPRARPAGAPGRHRPARAVARAQRADRRAGSGSTPRSSPPRSARRGRACGPTSSSPCTPATPPPTTRWRGRSSGRRRCARRPLLPPRHRRPARATPRPRRTRCSPGTASCASASRTPSPTGCAPRCSALQGYRVDVMQFVGSQHTPRNTLLRGVRTGSSARAAPPARSTTTW